MKVEGTVEDYEGRGGGGVKLKEEEEQQQQQQQQKGRLTVDLLLLPTTTYSTTTAEGNQGYCWESKTAGTERVTGIWGGWEWLRVARLLIPPDALHGLPAVTHTAGAAYDNL